MRMDSEKKWFETSSKTHLSISSFIGKLFSFRNKYVKVLCYRDIVNELSDDPMCISLYDFMIQMECLEREGYETFRFDDLTEITTGYKSKRVLIVFAGGKRSCYSEIFKLMNYLHLKYNVFLTVGKIGKKQTT